MEKGKIASQVGHCVQQLVEDILINHFNNNKSYNEIYTRYTQWRKGGCKKIILKGSQDQLELLKQNKESRYICDAGKTQIEAGSLTIVGFFPSCTNANQFSFYKLL